MGTLIAILIKSAAGDVMRANQQPFRTGHIDYAAHGVSEVKHPAFTHWKQARMKWETTCPKCGKDKKPNSLKCPHCGQETELGRIFKRRGLLEKRG